MFLLLLMMISKSFGEAASHILLRKTNFITIFIVLLKIILSIFGPSCLKYVSVQQVKLQYIQNIFQ